MVRVTMLTVVALIAVEVPSALGQDADEVTKLKREIEELKKENASLRKEIAALKRQANKKEAPGNTADLFAVGVGWEGTRTIHGNDKERQDWKLVVTKRSGGEFEGEITLKGTADGKDLTVVVKGNAPPKGDGVVSFTTEKKGAFKQTFTGRLKGGDVIVEFKGTSTTGKQTWGTARLSPKD